MFRRTNPDPAIEDLGKEACSTVFGPWGRFYDFRFKLVHIAMNRVWIERSNRKMHLGARLFHSERSGLDVTFTAMESYLRGHMETWLLEHQSERRGAFSRLSEDPAYLPMISIQEWEERWERERKEVGDAIEDALCVMRKLEDKGSLRVLSQARTFADVGVEVQE